MNDFKFTPGPWLSKKSAVHPKLDDGVNRNESFIICDDFCGPDSVYNKALILQAPEMAEALEDVQSYLEKLIRPEPDSCPDIVRQMWMSGVNLEKKIRDILKEIKR